MKTVIAILFTLSFFMNAGSASAQQTTAPTAVSTGTTYSLTVVISNVNNRTGKLYVGLANSSATFDGESFQQKTVDVPASGEITVVFDGLPSGKYAVRVFQDMNGNQKIDFNGQMPSEPFGFSNVTMLMGRPDFNESSFDLNENRSIRVRMIEM